MGEVLWGWAGRERVGELEKADGELGKGKESTGSIQEGRRGLAFIRKGRVVSMGKTVGQPCSWGQGRPNGRRQGLWDPGTLSCPRGGDLRSPSGCQLCHPFVPEIVQLWEGGILTLICFC